ncbi:MAG: CDP-alcohol phosphatidyltransferase family protein [Candidatus Aminicenantes bacterium]|nr:CDP-alcohol phosphatidyltransferase family protein [Candidatus Aminicenantes bacterium]
MPSDKSLPASRPEFDYGLASGKAESRFVPRFLQINKYLNRPVASLLVRAVFRTRVTANQLTWMSFLMGLGGAYCLFQGKTWLFLVGGGLAQLSSIVDCADGMLARARRQESRFGAYLDLVFDRVTEFFLLAGTAYGVYRATGRMGLLILGLVGGGLYFLDLTLYYLLKPYFGETGLGESAESRSWLMFLIFVFGAANRLDWGIYLLFGASTMILGGSLVRFFRAPKEG